MIEVSRRRRVPEPARRIRADREPQRRATPPKPPKRKQSFLGSLTRAFMEGVGGK